MCFFKPINTEAEGEGRDFWADGLEGEDMREVRRQNSKMEWKKGKRRQTTTSVVKHRPRLAVLYVKLRYGMGGL